VAAVLQRLAVLAALGGATAFVWLVDPSQGDLHPPCPSRLLLGLDCPLCGGLRGTHDLLHGRVVQALDHNLLLPAIFAVLCVVLAMWLLSLVGRRAPMLLVPRAVMVPAVGLVATFTVLRNLPVASLEFLGSGASGAPG
jgi:Protein of unknown function (DUF2752)